MLGAPVIAEAASEPPAPARRRLPLLHLIWIAVVAVVVDVMCVLAANIERCGISGCSGGGFGVRADPGGVIVAIVGAGVVTAALLLFVPWHRSRVVRGVVAVLGAAASWSFVAMQYAS